MFIQVFWSSFLIKFFDQVLIKFFDQVFWSRSFLIKKFFDQEVFWSSFLKQVPWSSSLIKFLADAKSYSIQSNRLKYSLSCFQTFWTWKGNLADVKFFDQVFWSSFLIKFFDPVFWSSFLIQFFDPVFWSSFLFKFFDQVLCSSFLLKLNLADEEPKLVPCDQV